MRKIKRKRRIKGYRVVIYIVLFVLIALTINSAYSYLINTLKIQGKVTIPKPETVNLCDGNLTYSINSWQNGENSYFYVITFTLENNGNTNYNAWNVYFDIPEDAEIASFSSIELSITGTRLRATNMHYNGNLQVGNSINFEIQLTTSNSNYEPKNISINDCYVANDGSDVTENNLSVDFQFTSMTGEITYQYNVVVTNTGTDAITNWTIYMKKPTNCEMVNVWNANYIVKDEYVEFSSMTWNGNLGPGESTSFGMMILTDQYRYKPELYE